MAWDGQERRTNVANVLSEESLRVIYEIRDRMIRVEEGQKRTEKSIEKIEAKVEKLEEKVDSTDSRATEALVRATEAQKDVEGLRSSNRWAWGTAATLLVGLVGVLLHFM